MEYFTLDTYINPVESGFYYLNSRYYDPEIRRFICADGYVSTGQDIAGYNIYIYCNNNPIIFADYMGTRCVLIPMIDGGTAIKTTKATKKTFVEKIVEDVKNFSISNISEKEVLESNYFSAYKGKLVVRTNSTRSGSFGVLFIKRDAHEREVTEDEVRHEYGHTEQLRQLGPVKYALCIGLPSLGEWGNDPDYYRRPWEITADIYGGVESRIYPVEYEMAGFDYLKNSKMFGPLVWMQIEWD